jgi:hypothetical protein
MSAVITADIINYSKLSPDEQDKLIGVIHKTFGNNSDIRTNVGDSSFAITRGDNIQIELKNADQALRAALLLKSAIKKIVPGTGNKTPADVRIAIGIGDISARRKNVGESTGNAYTFSGRTLDSMKKQKRTLAVKTNNTRLDAELDTELRLLEVILSGWTVNSAEVIFLTIPGLTEQEISNNLKISQSAVNQRKKSAGWAGIEPLLKRYEELIKQEENR